MVDSAGLKVYGEGEWKVYKHGRSKLHIATDVKTQQIIAAEMTSNSHDDASVVPDLLTHIDGNVVSLRGDGAYDKRSIYHTTSRLGIHPVIPPPRNGRYDQKGDWSQTEFTVTEPYLYRGDLAQSCGKSKLITINALSLK